MRMYTSCTSCTCCMHVHDTILPLLDLADRLKADEICPICQEELKENPESCVGFTCDGARTCSHVVHLHCAQAILARSKGACPTCRCPVDCTVSIDLPTLFAKEPVLLLSDVDALRAAVAGISSCVEGQNLPPNKYSICALLRLSNVCCHCCWQLLHDLSCPSVCAQTCATRGSSSYRQSSLSMPQHLSML